VNKNDLKNLLKPLIKEAVKEVILESGVLSSIVTEVANGLSNSKSILQESHFSQADKVTLVSNKRDAVPQQQAKVEEQRQELKKVAEEKQKSLQEKMAKLTGFDAFDGVAPLVESNSAKTPGEALRGVDPSDAGVNINGILNVLGGKEKWSRHLEKKLNKGQNER
jgi:hypothetical protein